MMAAQYKGSMIGVVESGGFDALACFKFPEFAVRSWHGSRDAVPPDPRI
jgi:hypothetical protein